MGIGTAKLGFTGDSFMLFILGNWDFLLENISDSSFL
jgi:hypothetical protein